MEKGKHASPQTGVHERCMVDPGRHSFPTVWFLRERKEK
jgi:hypothetical protein